MKKRNSFAILTIAGAAVLSLASCEKAQPEPKPDPGHQHTYSELHAKVEPTCLSEGVEAYYSCTGCDLLFNENKEVISQPEAIPALPHTPHHHDATDPSCTEPGTGEYWTCDNEGDDKLYGDKDCKEVIQSIPVVDPTGHDLSQMPGNPSTCKEAGWKEYYKCDDCDALFEDAEGKTSIADLEAWKKGAGKLDLAPHSAQFVAGQASTCKEHGWRDYYHCGGCDGYFEDQAATKPIADLAAWKVGAGKLELAAHTPVKQDGKAPTCTSDGWRDYYKCSVCDRLFEDEACETEITDLASWKSNAGKLPMGEHGHTLVSGKPSTCKEQGYADAYYCEGCEQYFEDAEAKTLIGDADAYAAWKLDGGQLPLAAHKVDKQDGQASSCTEYGWADYYKCSVCDRMFEEEACENEITNLDEWKVGRGQLPLLDHETSLIEGQEATCEEDGWEDYYQCSECKGYFEDEAGETPIADLAAWKIGDGKIPATGHDKDLTKTEKVEPTCYQTGVKEYYQCESCEQYFEDADAKTKITDLAAWKAGAGLIPATGDHDFDYSKTEVSWEGDMATAVAPCSTEGCTETVTESKQGSYVKDSDATCTSPELGHYEVTFDNTNFGSAQTDEGSVPHGDPHAHTFGSLIPEVDAQRGATGMKAHYVCGECGGFFDEDKNKSTVEELTIASRHHAFVVGEQEGVFELSHIYKPGEEVVFDVKFDDNNEFSICAYAENWKARTDFIKVFADGSNNQSSFVKSEIIDDGYVRVRINVTSISKWNDVEAGCLTDQVQSLHISRWNETSGYIEIEPSVVAHEYGDWIAKVEPNRETAGVLGHYHCSVCERNFDENYNEIENLSFTYQTTVVPNTDAFIKLKKAYDTTKDVFTVDFKITDVADDTKISVRLYNSKKGVDPYIGYFNFTKNLSETPWGGVKKSVTCDNYIRLEFDLKNITTFGGGDKPDTIDSIQVRGIWTTANAVIEPEADYVQHEALTFVDEVKTFRNETGIRGHYLCEDCGRYFDENMNELSESQLTLPSRLYTVNSGTTEQSIPFACGANDTINLEVKVDDPDGAIFIGFRDQTGSWVRTTNIKLYGNGQIEYTDKVGTKSLEGATVLGKTDDGYWRLKVDLSKMDKENGFTTVTNVLIYKWNHSAGMIDIDPAMKAPIVMYSGEFKNGTTYDIKNAVIPAKTGKIVATFDFGDETSKVKTHLMFGDGWSNYYGYFGVYNDGTTTATFSGVTSRLVETNVVEVTFDLAEITTAGGNIDLINVINLFYIHGTWGTATGGQCEVLYYAM